MAYLGYQLDSYSAQDNPLIVALEAGSPKAERKIARREKRERVLEITAKASRRAAAATGTVLGEAVQNFREAKVKLPSAVEPIAPAPVVETTTVESNFFPDTVPTWMNEVEVTEETSTSEETPSHA